MFSVEDFRDYVNHKHKDLVMLEPPKLSPKSRKKLNEIKTGDIIYVDSNKNIVSQKKSNNVENRPIGIVLKNMDGRLTVVAINYGSLINPEKGVTNDYAYVPVMTDNPVISDDLNCSSKRGFENMKLIYDYINKTNKARQDCHYEYRTNIINRKANSGEPFNAPVIYIVSRYKTPGTKSGQWFLPSAEEAVMIMNYEDLIKKASEKIYDNIYKFNPRAEEIATSTLYKSNNYLRIKKVLSTGEIEETYTERNMYVLPFIEIVE